MDIANESSGKSRPRFRAIRLRLMALLVVLLPFLLIEIGLRLWVDDAALSRLANDPVVQLEQSQPLFELQNQRWVIPESRYNFFQPDSFAATKPPGSRRVFVLGGSTTQGRPYSIETSFATWLKLRLQAAAPDIPFEVVNCGGVSYASYRVAKIAEEVLKHQPDAIVLYTGHNEFLEDREFEKIRDLSPWRRKLTQVAANIRTVAWLKSQFSDAPVRMEQSLPGEVDASLDHVGGLDKYVRDRNWTTSIESQFRTTFLKMISSIKEADVPLIVCVPRSDLVNTPPFKITTKSNLDSAQEKSFALAWTDAQDHEADLQSRVAACQQCLVIDPQHSGAHYILGRLQYEQGETQIAKQHLVSARDFDVCPLRATSPIVQAVLDETARNQIDVIDPLTILDAADHEGRPLPDGIVDPTFFVDHVHPSVAGHQRIASSIAKHFMVLGWFQPAEDKDSVYAKTAEEHLGHLGPEYFERGRQRLKGLQRWAAGRASVPLLPTAGPRDGENH